MTDPVDDPSGDDAPAAPPPAPPCFRLRSKGMYVYTDGAVDGPHGDDGSTIYWCLKTMKTFGPDDDLVGRWDCSNPERPCYESP